MSQLWTLGGTTGRRARFDLPVLPVLTLITGLTWIIGYIMRLPCRVADFGNADRYVRMCYTDIPYLFTGRGLNQGILPYLQTAPNSQSIEYPVLTGWFMWLAAKIGSANGSAFYDANAALLLICFVVTVVATVLTLKNAPWVAVVVAASPIVVMTGLINWDLLAVALTSLALLMWSRAQYVASGVFLGLAISAKFYPIVILGAIALWALRHRQFRGPIATAIATAFAWLVVNVPFIVVAREEWLRFYQFSQERGTDFGSLWLALQYLVGMDTSHINVLVAVTLVALTTAISVVVLTAPTPANLWQISFLLVAAFTMSNKVYSPQYGLWLLPLAVLAYPHLRTLMVWMSGQVVYTVAIWLFLEQYGQEDRKGIPEETYALSIAFMLILTTWFAVRISKDLYLRSNMRITLSA